MSGQRIDLILRLDTEEMNTTRSVALWPRVTFVDPSQFPVFASVPAEVDRIAASPVTTLAAIVNADGIMGAFLPSEPMVNPDEPELSMLAGWLEVILHELVERTDCGIDPHPADGSAEQWDWARAKILALLTDMRREWPTTGETI